MVDDAFKSVVAVITIVSIMSGCSSQERGGVPEDVIRQNTLGTAYLGQQEWQLAAAEFRKGLDLRAADPLLLSNLSVALMQDGSPDEAEVMLRAALESDPLYPYAHYNLGLIESDRGGFEEAVSHFEVVAEHDPQDVLTLYHLGVAYASVDRAEDARKALQRALDIDPESVSTLYALGRELVKAGERDQGRELIAKSQAIRARSGLDVAVGSQYGEQGPYAMGIDYPADALAAPKPVAVSFAVADDVSAKTAGVWTLTRVAPENDAALIAADGGSLAGLRSGSGDLIEIPRVPDSGRVLSLTAGDGDNDGVIELYALTASSDGTAQLSVLEQTEDGIFGWTGTRRFAGDDILPSHIDLADLLLVDRDHDGDLDLLICWSPATESSCAVATNDGEGAFTVARSSEHGFDLRLGTVDRLGLYLTDFDNDRDIDFVVSAPSGIHALTNHRDGTFGDIGDDIGLGPAAKGLESVVIKDIDKDGWMDVIAGGKNGLWLFTNKHGKFGAPEQLAGHTDAVDTVAVFDADNDGFLDVTVSGDSGQLASYRNIGAGRWQPTRAWWDGVSSARVVDSFDADGDGDLDAVGIADDRVLLLRNSSPQAHGWISIDSLGVGDNRSGVGSKVEILAGALRQKFEVDSPMPLHAGLGPRSHVDSIRHLWPTGVLQDEINQSAGSSVAVTQLDRKGTSCPILYVQRDGQWEFVTDFLGGSAVGYQLAPGVFNMPDTDEYIKLTTAPTADEHGMLRLRVNNQLQEVIWFDQLELVAVDHPAGTELFPNERLMPRPPWPDYGLFVSADVRPVNSATGVEDRSDWTGSLAFLDGQYVKNFSLKKFKGYADMHTLEIDLGQFENDERVVMLLDGWIDYADSTANVAAAQADLRLTPPILKVADGNGGWRDTGHLMGFPAGLPKTIAVDVTDLFDTDDHRVRIATNMRIYWDRARILVGGDDLQFETHRLKPLQAELSHGGFPAEIGGDRSVPKSYDPQRVSTVSPWNAHVGKYTGFGDVKELVTTIDDRMVTTRAGDQIELTFRTPGTVPDGFTRTFLLYADGFGKDMDPNSAANYTVGPIPFHDMPSYPYPESVVRPADFSATLTRPTLDSEDGSPGALPLVLAPQRGEPQYGLLASDQD